MNSAIDIFNIAIAIHDNRIGPKLASDIHKNPTTNPLPANPPIMDKDSALIIQKLNEVIETNKKLVKSNEQLITENNNLKGRLSSLESKVDRYFKSSRKIRSQQFLQSER